MKISFDPAKRAKTLAERGLDFADAGKVFASPKSHPFALSLSKGCLSAPGVERKRTVLRQAQHERWVRTHDRRGLDAAQRRPPHHIDAKGK